MRVRCGAMRQSGNPAESPSSSVPMDLCLYEVGSRVNVVGVGKGVVCKVKPEKNTGIPFYYVKVDGKGGHPSKHAEANLSPIVEENEDLPKVDPPDAGGASEIEGEDEKGKYPEDTIPREESEGEALGKGATSSNSEVPQDAFDGKRVQDDATENGLQDNAENQLGDNAENQLENNPIEKQIEEEGETLTAAGRLRSVEVLEKQKIGSLEVATKARMTILRCASL